ncbi:MAG: amino acid adenylation domain-containing protein, partial [bacterium]|nr:amino acid adenylation domain-containing protein [bacterium]
VGGIHESPLQQTQQTMHITYRELNRNANQLAGHLRAKGARKDDTVGILMERSLSMITSILAVWKAGSAYIPLDPHTPVRRITGVLEDSGTKIVVSQPQYVTPQLKETYTHTVILPPLKSSTTNHPAHDNPGIKISKQDLAYVIYTSGSTGKPKGAMVEHLGMQNHMQAKVRDLKLTEKSIVAQNASHTFDISVWQLFVALLNGGKTVIFENELVLNHTQFLTEIIKEKITILEVVPSYLSVILEEIETTSPELPVKYLLVTGEEVKVNLVNRWFNKYPQIKMVNAYGPTEASDDITHYIMDKPLKAGQQRVPIGKPLQNLDIYIVDKTMKLLPVGIKGELCVAGDGVGRGYLKDEKRTREVFTQDPFKEKKGIRLYKTGDLARWYPDGTIEFLGRIDYQVKIRGYRIELGEIERRLLTHPQLKETVVLARVSKNGDKFLCAYYVSGIIKDEPGAPLPEQELLPGIKDLLAQNLPNYMIPAHFIQLEKMPLTPNGKTDRKTLSQYPVSNIQTQTHIAPRNKIDEKMVKVWADILGIPKEEIGIDGDFFQLGGHSLRATIMSARIHKEFNVKLPLTEIFKNSTIRTLSDTIKECAPDKYVTIENAEKKDYYIASAAQKRLYVLQQMELENTAYNMPQIIPLADDTD